MDRRLTAGEKEMVVNALFAHADEFRVESLQVLGGLTRIYEELEFDTDKDEPVIGGGKVDELAQTIRSRSKSLMKRAKQYANLALFIQRYPVTVDCIITIPEQG